MRRICRVEQVWTMTTGYETPSFCGHCGVSLEAAAEVCASCGYLVTYQAPPDYVPYCRNCGVGVPWGEGHTCHRCGLTPLCELHFNANQSLCFECASVPASPSDASGDGGLSCGACGAAVSPDTDYCANCGRALSFATASATVEYMGFWIRAGAFVVDWIVAYVAAAVVAAVIGFSVTSGEVDPAAAEDLSIALDSINYSFLLMFWGMAVAHSVILTAWRGQTLGKMLLRIQVVDARGNVPPLPRVLAREMIRAVILLALVPLGLLYISAALDLRKRGWHDYLGTSYVVRKQRAARPPGAIF